MNGSCSTDTATLVQNARILDETLQRIKKELKSHPLNHLTHPSESNPLNELVLQLEQRLQQQHDIVFAALPGISTTVPLKQEPLSVATSPLEKRVLELETSNRVALKEIDTHRRMHVACHQEVHRLRKLLKSLEAQSEHKFPSPSDELKALRSFQALQRKLSVKMARYLDILRNLEKTLQRAVLLMPAEEIEPAVVALLSLQKDIKYHKELLSSGN